MAFNICYGDVIGEGSGKMPHTAGRGLGGGGDKGGYSPTHFSVCS